MKPDWKDAPEWAQWLACDEDGNWYWYEESPYCIVNECAWSIPTNVEFECAGCTNGEICENWQETLEERPCIS